MEQDIIKPISRELLKAELTPERQLRMTNKSHNEIYVITAKQAPNVMLAPRGGISYRGRRHRQVGRHR